LDNTCSDFFFTRDFLRFFTIFFLPSFFPPSSIMSSIFYFCPSVIVPEGLVPLFSTKSHYSLRYIYKFPPSLFLISFLSFWLLFPLLLFMSQLKTILNPLPSLLSPYRIYLLCVSLSTILVLLTFLLIPSFDPSRIKTRLSVQTPLAIYLPNLLYAPCVYDLFYLYVFPSFSFFLFLSNRL